MKKRLPIINCCTPLAGSSLAESEAIELERLFRVLADRHRLKILNILLRARGEAVCVCEFTDHLGLAQPTDHDVADQGHPSSGAKDPMGPRPPN